MNKKYIILDTETTGLEVQQGHKIIEIGAVLLNDRRKSDQHFHTYLNPQRIIDEEASKVHGITNADLEDKPLFEEIVALRAASLAFSAFFASVITFSMKGRRARALASVVSIRP